MTAEAGACVVLPDAGALAEEAVQRFESAAREAIERAGQFTVALTGGSVAASVYGALVRAQVDWAKVHLFWGDERCVPQDHPDSNFRLAREALLDHIAIPLANVHRMPGERADRAEAAATYEQILKDIALGELDLVHLGMGPDGHVCSLFPGHRLVVQEQTRLVAPIEDAPKPPPARLTLTLPALFRAREVCFLVAGVAKAKAVQDARKNPQSTAPAAIVARRHARAVWLLDREAASLLA